MFGGHGQASHLGRCKAAEVVASVFVQGVEPHDLALLTSIHHAEILLEVWNPFLKGGHPPAPRITRCLMIQQRSHSLLMHAQERVSYAVALYIHHGLS